MSRSRFGGERGRECRDDQGGHDRLLCFKLLDDAGAGQVAHDAGRDQAADGSAPACELGDTGQAAHGHLGTPG